MDLLSGESLRVFPQVLAPAVEWLDFISYFLAPLELTDAEPVVVYGREYLEQVSQLINNTDKRYLRDITSIQL